AWMPDEDLADRLAPPRRPDEETQTRMPDETGDVRAAELRPTPEVAPRLSDLRGEDALPAFSLEDSSVSSGDDLAESERGVWPSRTGEPGWGTKEFRGWRAPSDPPGVGTNTD